MTGKVSVVIEQDDPPVLCMVAELKGCQTQGKTVEETLTDIRKAIELFLETPTDEERSEALSHEIPTTAVDVQRRFVRGSDMADSYGQIAGPGGPAQTWRSAPLRTGPEPTWQAAS